MPRSWSAASSPPADAAQAPRCRRRPRLHAQGLRDQPDHGRDRGARRGAGGRRGDRARIGELPRPIEFPVEGLTDGVVRLRLPADADVPRIVEACRDPRSPATRRSPPTTSPTTRPNGCSAGSRGLPPAPTSTRSSPPSTAPTSSARSACTRSTATPAAASPATSRRSGRGGSGIASRALDLICRYAFDELRLARVEVTIEPENTASRATAESVGFVEEGILRSYLHIAGARRDMLMYSLLPGDLRPAEK